MMSDETVAELRAEQARLSAQTLAELAAALGDIDCCAVAALAQESGRGGGDCCDQRTGYLDVIHEAVETVEQHLREARDAAAATPVASSTVPVVAERHTLALRRLRGEGKGE